MFWKAAVGKVQSAFGVNKAVPGCPVQFGTKYIFWASKIGSLCPKNRRKIGNYRPKMAFL